MPEAPPASKRRMAGSLSLLRRLKTGCCRTVHFESEWTVELADLNPFSGRSVALEMLWCFTGRLLGGNDWTRDGW